MYADNLPDPIVITKPKALRDLASTLAKQPIIAVDTESNSLYAYQEQVCLIQFSASEKDYLVDPLALDDLSALAPIFSNPAIEKVFHAAEYDIICMKRDFGFHFENLFDTMLAGRILGRSAIGLGSMLEEAFGVTLNKQYQRANWGTRPLPPHLLAYARLDTHYLIGLRDRLRQELIDKDLLPIAQEDFVRMSQNSGGNSNGASVTDSCWRIGGAQFLSPQQAAVLHELCQYRDQQARYANKPVFKIMSNEVLLTLAQECPTRPEDLHPQRGLSPRLLKRHAKGLIDAIQRGLNAPPLRRPTSRRPEESISKRQEALRDWRKHTAQAAGVESDIILPREFLYMIAEANPKDLATLGKLMHSVPWRFEHYGKEILLLIHELEETQ